MANHPLTEREFELINIVGAKIATNQRDLSLHLNLSLGMTNMLIRRLIAKGYIRIKQLNKRKVEYILTPKGLTEKLQKSIKYTIKTINSIGLIKGRLKKILLKLHSEGCRNFYILGESDLATLVEIGLKEHHLNDCTVRHISQIPQEKMDGVILVCTELTDHLSVETVPSVNILEELAKENDFMAEAVV